VRQLAALEVAAGALFARVPLPLFRDELLAARQLFS
jgi:hypothetical protein